MTQSNLARKIKKQTDADYLKLERKAETKHELIGGKIVAMAGASDRHNVIVSNLFLDLGLEVRKNGCRTFSSDVKVKANTGNYFYPDIVITCGEREFEDEKNDVLLNPVVIIEVLSKSTKLKDRNQKFDAYLKLKSLTDYVLVEQGKIRVEHFFRNKIKCIAT